MEFYIGTYTRQTGSGGIYYLVLKGDRHELTLAVAADNPSWLIRKNHRVYAVGEFNNGDVCVYNEREPGVLELMQTESSEGDDPCHLLVGEDSMITTNYTSGSFTKFGIGADGSLSSARSVDHTGSSVDPVRQEAAHAHSSIRVGDCIVVADLGMDRLMVYNDDLQPVTQVEVTAGAGPRLMLLSSDRLHVICELSNTIETWQLNGLSFTHIDSVSTLPEGFAGSSFAAHLEMSRDGRFLYGSNRGHDSIVVMEMNEGLPRPIQWVPTGGAHPRYFKLTEHGTMLMAANRDDNSIILFSRNEQSGLLTDMDQAISVPAPVCIVQID